MHPVHWCSQGPECASGEGDGQSQAQPHPATLEAGRVGQATMESTRPSGMSRSPMWSFAVVETSP